MVTERIGPDLEPGRLGRVFARPYRLQLPLDGICLALMALTLAQVGNPDILLHVVWVALAVEAVLFGAWTAGIRIAVASVFVVAYALIANGFESGFAVWMADLDLEEWPLMIAIAAIVAILADRVTTTGKRYAALYRAASDRLITAQEDERRILAADLHDGVGQSITALGLTLDAAETALRSGDGGTQALDAVRRARTLAGTTLEDVRGVAFRLRPARLLETGLVAALGELAASAGTPVEFIAHQSLVRPGLVADDVKVDAYRIVQEALGNAARHAQATRIVVRVTRLGRRLRIEVEDDGVGFDPRAQRAEGLGLASIRDRALAIGATLRIRSQPGTGTLVQLDLPLAGSPPPPAASAAVPVPVEGQG